MTKSRKTLLAGCLTALALTACGVPEIDGDVLDITGPIDATTEIAEKAELVIDTLTPAEPMATRFIGSYSKLFDDKNDVQLEAGHKLGIAPLTSTKAFWDMRRPLKKLTDNPDFKIDNLTHSKPYLVPEAAELLHEIGHRFNDSLAARGGGDYRIIVTSILRTADDIRRLRRVNRNAVEMSVHQMATTFDITYGRFDQTGNSVIRREQDLTALLAEVVNDLRNEGRCYVKYEVKQRCLHITARPKNSPKP